MNGRGNSTTDGSSIRDKGYEKRVAALHRANAKRFEQRYKEYTGEQKRCSKCREWKYLHYFNKTPRGLGGVRADCRDCQIKANRLRSYAWSEEEYARQIKRTQKRANARRQKAEVERREDAQRIVDFLYGELKSFYKICDMTGISRYALHKIHYRKVNYVHRDTHKKLKHAYVDFMEFRALQ